MAADTGEACAESVRHADFTIVLKIVPAAVGCVQHGNNRDAERLRVDGSARRERDRRERPCGNDDGLASHLHLLARRR